MPDIHPPNPAQEQIHILAAELLKKRQSILSAWRKAGEGSEEENIAPTLSRTQFNDHIPVILDRFEHTLRAWPDVQGPLAEQIEAEGVGQHGMQRWQQGYQLPELIGEWENLQTLVADELEDYASTHPELDPIVMPTVRRIWAQLCAGSITQSVTQYGKLQQTESAGRVTNLQAALAALQGIESSRAQGWRTAAHDLRGNVTVLTLATTFLQGKGSELPDKTRTEVAEMLVKSVSSLNEMLTDLLNLARLEAGQEQREITTFDAAVLLRDFCTASQHLATDRGLYLKMDGPNELMIEGDKIKIQRILQNLLLNAIKYTRHGGVSVTWGTDESHHTNRWTFSVKDTGPGINNNHNAPMAHELHEATKAGNDVRADSKHPTDDIAPATTLPSASHELPPNQQAGEGVGLTIVKRLCELLDAGLELATTPGQGTTFRVILPKSYAKV
jgi:signal transduction histidine kinase